MSTQETWKERSEKRQLNAEQQWQKKKKRNWEVLRRNRQAKTSWGLEDFVKGNKTSNPDKKARGSRKQGEGANQKRDGR